MAELDSTSSRAFTRAQDNTKELEDLQAAAEKALADARAEAQKVISEAKAAAQSEQSQKLGAAKEVRRLALSVSLRRCLVFQG